MQWSDASKESAREQEVVVQRCRRKEVNRREPNACSSQQGMSLTACLLGLALISQAQQLVVVTHTIASRALDESLAVDSSIIKSDRLNTRTHLSLQPASR